MTILTLTMMIMIKELECRNYDLQKKKKPGFHCASKQFQFLKLMSYKNGMQFFNETFLLGSFR